MIAGQFLDVSVQARGASDVEQAMRVLRYKSAKYSIERPLHVGAALAGGSAEVLDALSRFGLPLGEAFPLRDDPLGVSGDPSHAGKPAGDDLTEGKRTVLVALALEHADPEEAKRLDAALGRPLSPEEVADLRRIIDTSGAHAEVERRIDVLTRESLAALDRAPVTEPAEPLAPPTPAEPVSPAGQPLNGRPVRTAVEVRDRVIRRRKPPGSPATVEGRRSRH